MNNDNPTPAKSSNLKFSFDLRIITLLLLAIIVAMTFIWKPWNEPNTNDRTIEVAGEAKITAVPDEYVFYPNYEFKNADKTAALAELTKKSDEIVAKLKTLGVADNKIKTNSSGNNYQYYYDITTKNSTYNLQLTVTVSDKDIAQKVQDFLVTTTPIGAVSPQANFSDTKRKALESQARDKATKEARSKADQSAKNLGFKVGSVKSVNDGAGFNVPIYAQDSKASAVSGAPEAQSSLAVQPGENDLTYSVTVTYFIH